MPAVSPDPKARRALVFVIALGLALLSIWQLERPRVGLDFTTLTIGDTPVTRIAATNADGPVVIIAHGFAGSRQMMQGYAQTLARAGYITWAFDFEGHGQHPIPMSGDVNVLDGTTQKLIHQTQSVIKAARAQEATTQPIALLGHSMATDVLVRTAMQTPDIGPLVLLSAFSQAVDATTPRDLLLITGQWEPGLRAFGLRAVQMVDPEATEGMAAINGDIRRKAVVAPFVEHVAILHQRTGRDAALAWLNESYGRDLAPRAQTTGPWIIALLGALVALVYPLSTVLPARASPAVEVPARSFWAAALIPALITPLVAVWIPLNTLPVLVADYLALHLLIYGALQLLILWRAGIRPGPASALAVAALTFWGIAVFGLALHHYAANFLPTPQRMLIIAVLAIGAVPFMLADATLTQGGDASLGRRWGARAAFLGSLGIAVALDLEGLFFLLMIAPVILLFYIVFGLMGRWVAARGGASSAGVGQGLILAWALGVSFPLFATMAAAP